MTNDREEEKVFSNFFCTFLNANIFFLFGGRWYWYQMDNAMKCAVIVFSICHIGLIVYQGAVRIWG